MKNRGSWRGTLVVVFAIGAGWIGYMGWPLYGLITLAAEQSNSPNRPQARAVVQDPNCPGNDNHALMCRLVNEYRAKHGLKPVQLDDAVTREAQYWSDQLNRQSACWFLYHDYNYHARMRARFPGRRFRATPFRICEDRGSAARDDVCAAVATPAIVPAHPAGPTAPGTSG